jgi:hypothetical protein
MWTVERGQYGVGRKEAWATIRHDLACDMRNGHQVMNSRCQQGAERNRHGDTHGREKRGDETDSALPALGVCQVGVALCGGVHLRNAL